MTENKNNVKTDVPVRNPESIGITLKNIVNEIAAGISSSDFQEIITTLKNKPSVAKSLYELQTKDVINDNHQIIDKMYSETGVDAKYDEITKLINDSTTDNNSVAWRPVTGDCEMQLAAYRKKSLVEKKQKLEKLLQDERSRRFRLKMSLDRKRSHVESLLKHMDSAKTLLYRNSENYIE